MKLKNKIFITFLFLLSFILFFNIDNVFASEIIAFEGNVEEGAWNTIIELPEYLSGNNYLYVTKYYSNYKVFFVKKVLNYKCYYVKESNLVSKYGILNEGNHLYFNQPVVLNIYKISSDGSSCIKEYSDVNEESFICINPYDHSYSNTDIYTDNTYTTIFFQSSPTEKTKTLAEIMKTAGEQATLEVGQIILIVIMITAGLTVLLIGLRKGLTVLMNGFRH